MGPGWRPGQLIAWRADLVRWWPVAPIGLYLVAIRLGDPVATVAWWTWAAIAVVFVLLLVGHRRDLRFGPTILLFGGYWVYVAASLAWSPAPGRGLRFVALLGTALLAFVYGRTVGSPGADSMLWQGATVGFGISLAGSILFGDPQDFEGLNPDRILAMGAVALVVLAWYGPRGRLYTLGLGLIGLATILLSTARTTTAVMAILLICAPGLRLRPSRRWMIAGSLFVLALLLTFTPAFQQRWFESGSGSLRDLLTGRDVETSGRSEVWPAVAGSCVNPILGDGAGTSDAVAVAVHSGFPEPHNEYLRVWCDTGLIGTVLLWGFVATILVRAIGSLRVRPRSWEGWAALQLAVALLMLSLTDNPLTTAVPFLIPAALVFGWLDSSQQPDPA